jgi:hypothetical protein
VRAVSAISVVAEWRIRLNLASGHAHLGRSALPAAGAWLRNLSLGVIGSTCCQPWRYGTEGMATPKRGDVYMGKRGIVCCQPDGSLSAF